MLKFYAREDALVRYPGIVAAFGQAPRYIGREFLIGEAERGADGKMRTTKPASHPATKDPAEFVDGTPEAEAAKRHCRKGALWAADKATAAACGVAFVETEFKGGAWVAKSTKKQPVSEPEPLKETA